MPKKTSHEAVPWLKIFKNAVAKTEDGKPKMTIQAMAESAGYWNPKSGDPGQEFRGKLSFARTRGVRFTEADAAKLPEGIKTKKAGEGYVTAFLPKETSRRSTRGKARVKGGTKKKSAGRKPRTQTPVDGETVEIPTAFSMENQGEFLKVASPKPISLVAFEQIAEPLAAIMKAHGFRCYKPKVKEEQKVTVETPQGDGTDEATIAAAAAERHPDSPAAVATGALAEQPGDRAA